MLWLEIGHRRSIYLGILEMKEKTNGQKKKRDMNNFQVEGEQFIFKGLRMSLKGCLISKDPCKSLF